MEPCAGTSAVLHRGGIVPFWAEKRSQVQSAIQNLRSGRSVYAVRRMRVGQHASEHTSHVVTAALHSCHTCSSASSLPALQDLKFNTKIWNHFSGPDKTCRNDWQPGACQLTARQAPQLLRNNCSLLPPSALSSTMSTRPCLTSTGKGAALKRCPKSQPHKVTNNIQLWKSGKRKLHLDLLEKDASLHADPCASLSATNARIHPLPLFLYWTSQTLCN